MKLSTGVSRIFTVILAVCAFILISQGVFAQDESAATPLSPEIDPIIAAEQALSLEDNAAGPVQAAPVASAWGIFRVLLTLALVAVAIYGLVFCIKRFSRGTAAQDPFLKVLAYTSLGNNRGAYILSVGSRAWLVGAAENGVHLISEIEEKEVLDAMLLEDSRRMAETPAGHFPDFKALLRRLGVSADSAAPSSPENIRKRSERLRGLK